jgi:hypothetical protein
LPSWRILHWDQSTSSGMWSTPTTQPWQSDVRVWRARWSWLYR